MRSFLPLIKTEWRLLAFGFVMTFCSSFGQTFFIALFSGEIRGELSLSHSAFGAIYSAATLVSAILLLRTGSLIDRMDLRRFSYAVILLLAAGCLILAGSTGVLMLFLAILVLRQAGQALMSMAGATAMVRYLNHEKGKANALAGMGYSIAEAILPLAVVGLMLLVGWRQSWVIFTGALLFLPWLVRVLLRDQTERHRQYLDRLERPQVDGEDAERPLNKQRQWTRDEMLRDPLFYMFIPTLLAQPMLFTGFMFHQIHLVESKGWSLAFWGSLYALYAITSTLMKIFAGLLIDRFGAIRLVPFVSLPMGLGFLLLASSNAEIAAALFMVLLGITVGGYATLNSPFFAEKYGTLHLGSIKSVTTALMVFASAIAPVVMGGLIDLGVSMEWQAIGSLVYVLVAASLARLAYLKTAAHG